MGISGAIFIAPNAGAARPAVGAGSSTDGLRADGAVCGDGALGGGAGGRACAALIRGGEAVSLSAGCGMTDAAGAAIAAAGCGNAVSAEIGAEGDADCASDPATVTFAGEASRHNPTPLWAAMATAAINPASPRVSAPARPDDPVLRRGEAVGRGNCRRTDGHPLGDRGHAERGRISDRRRIDRPRSRSGEQPRLRPVRPEFAHRRSKREVAE